jgi:hypothetical protein
VELWAKWPVDVTLAGEKLVRTQKLRWLRKFDTEQVSTRAPKEIPLDSFEQPKTGSPPALGCNVELTELQTSTADVWWTFAFEAFGTIYTVERSLHDVAKELSQRNPPDLGAGILASYPIWLDKYCSR